MTIEINGMARVILTVSRFDLARAFWKATSQPRQFAATIAVRVGY